MTTQILGLCGSLRKGSFNRKLLATACDTAKRLNANIEVGEFRNFPLYDADLQERGFRADATTLADQVLNADAVLFVSPEYYYSIPGALKRT